MEQTFPDEELVVDRLRLTSRSNDRPCLAVQAGTNIPECFRLHSRGFSSEMPIPVDWVLDQGEVRYTR